MEPKVEGQYVTVFVKQSKTADPIASDLKLMAVIGSIY